MWFDYDRDGRLDLFVANYVEWSVDKDLFCTLDGKTKSYCTPESYKGQSSTLYRNKGDGTFEDVTRAGGPLRSRRRRRSASRCIDYDSDGLLDIFVANDTQPNRLYRNKGNGTFVDVGHDGRRGVQRGRRRPRRHGRRRGRLRRLRPAEPRHRQLLERDDGALLERGQRPVHRRGADVDDRQGVAPDADVRLLLLRLRPRRPARHLRRQRPRRRRHRRRAAEGHLRAAAAPVPEPRREEVRRGDARARRGAAAARRRRGAPPTATTTTTATSTCSSPTNNGPARLLRNDGGNRNNRLRITCRGHDARTATASARGCASRSTTAGGCGAWSRPARATARRASCR